VVEAEVAAAVVVEQVQQDPAHQVGVEEVVVRDSVCPLKS
jgi:hypothetical protein